MEPARDFRDGASENEAVGGGLPGTEGRQGRHHGARLL